jgi:hypothetical protein
LAARNRRDRTNRHNPAVSKVSQLMTCLSAEAAGGFSL